MSDPHTTSAMPVPGASTGAVVFPPPQWNDTAREVPHAPSARLVQCWPGAQLLSTAGLGHRRVLADAAVGGAVARFVDRLPVEPSLHGDDRPQPFADEVADGASGVGTRTRAGAA